MLPKTQNLPLEPDQLASWEDDGGGCACGKGHCVIHSEEKEEKPIWERTSVFLRNLVSPIH
jgi:hypothetical protein